MAALVFGLTLAPTLGRTAEPAKAPPAPRLATADQRMVPPDPAYRRGVLANGLRYFVLSNASPKGALSIRLGMDVGSFEEADDELGVAHFIEHLAFRATAGFPEGALERAFAPSGVAYGRDQNAATDMWSTRYELDLHDTEAAHLDLAFRWLRDVADGVSFEPGGVDRERGVVLAEKAARDGPGDAVGDAIDAFESPGLRSTGRRPVGTEAVLRTVSVARLRAFYDRWYRPEHAVLVVVGDLPAEQLEARVKAGFETWQGRGPQPVRAARRAPDLTRSLDAVTISETRLGAYLTACRQRAVDVELPDDIAHLRRRLLSDLWTKILSQRLDKVRLRETSVLSARVSTSAASREMHEACLKVSPTSDAWEPALTLAQAELRRFAKDGPTEREVDQAIEDRRADLVAIITQAETRDSARVAAFTLERALVGRAYAAPRETLRGFDLALDGISARDVKAAFDRDWSGAGPFLSMVAPKAPPREVLLAAWTRNDKADSLASYVDAKAVKWAYPDPPKPGKVVQRAVLTNPDFVRLRFANGVVLNFKHTAYAKGAVEIRVRFGAGRREVPDHDYVAAQLALGLFPAGGVGRHSIEELSAIFGASELQFSTIMTDRFFVISKTSLASDLGDQAQLLTAYFSDPGFRETIDPKIPTALDITYRTARSSLPLTVVQALTESVSPGLPTNLPPQASVAGLNSKDFARLLKPAVTQAPLDVTVVGDIEEADAVRRIAETFGTLAPRAPRTVPPNAITYLRFPEGPRPEVRATHDGPADKAAALLVWPLYVATPTRRKEEYALKALAVVFANELRHEVRERSGKTYSPQVEATLPDFADQGELYAYMETQPVDIPAVQAAAVAVAARLAKGEITAEMLTAAQTPRLAATRAFTQSNRWWALALSGSGLDDGDLRDLMADEPLTAQVTLEEVRQVAATWLARAPLAAVTLPVAAGKTEAVR